MLYVFVNFSENNHHGCDLKCPFCEWSKQDYGQYYCPSYEDLLKLHHFKPEEEVWQITGGGEPLYHYELNRDKIKFIADFAHEHGHKVQILTRKTDVVLKYFDDLSQFIDYWYFSMPDQPNKTLISFFEENNKQFTVNVVLNFSEKEEINWDRINYIIYNYDSPIVREIRFRENFIHPFYKNKSDNLNFYKDIKEKLKEISPKAKLLSHLSVHVLWKGEITTTPDIDRKDLHVTK